MFLPPYLQRWILLNSVRLFTIVACALVIGATIELLCRDFSKYHISSVESTAGYRTGTDIPSTFLGVFWTTLHYTYLITVLLLVLLSELSLPVPTLDRLFKNFLPFLGPNWGTGFLGGLLLLLASDTLSRSSQHRFPLASSWILAITGSFNVVLGTIWRAKGKLLRSPMAWKHSVAQRMNELADIKAQAENFTENHLTLPTISKDIDRPVATRSQKQGVLQSFVQKTIFRSDKGYKPQGESSRPLEPTLHSDQQAVGEGKAAPVTLPVPIYPAAVMAKGGASPLAIPARPASVATRSEPFTGSSIAIPAAVPFVLGNHRDPTSPSEILPLSVTPSNSPLIKPLPPFASVPRLGGTGTSSLDSTISSSLHTVSSSVSSCYSPRASHEYGRGGRAALLEALSAQCQSHSSDSNYSDAPVWPGPQLKEIPGVKAVRFKKMPVPEAAFQKGVHSHNAFPSVSSVYMELLPPSASSKTEGPFTDSDSKLPQEAEELLGVHPTSETSEPQLSPSVVASYKAAMLEAEAKARTKKLKKSLYLGSDKWLADRRKNDSPTDAYSDTEAPSRPYDFL